MKIKNQAISLYELGKRTNQEDSIFPPGTGIIKTGDLYILCDGMGGHDKGEVASDCVCKSMCKYIDEHPSGMFGIEQFNAALSAAYDALDTLDSQEEEKKMGTTMTFLKFHEGGAFIAHIGDSRIYHIRPSEKKILYVTKDHSLINELIDLGELTPEQAKQSSQKNIITRAMQPHQAKRSGADCYNISDVHVGDYFFLCSDGVIESMDDEQLCNIISLEGKTDKEKMEIIKNVTKENNDNHSAHLIHITDVDGMFLASDVSPKKENNSGKRLRIVALLLVFAIIAAFVIAWFVLKIF